MSVQEVTAGQAVWYSPAPGQEKRDTVAEAYHTAVELLKKELGIKSGQKIPEDNFASIQDVCATVDQAKQRYDDASKSHSGARRWLEKLSSRVVHYQPVMDALAQHHPEYVALAWGTVKLILTGIINRAHLIKELAEALVNIADILPRAHLNVELYRTADIKSALSRLYACILMFFRLCARWYKKGSWGRLWSSLKDPFELKYKDLLVDIKRSSDLVESFAVVGARVEVRNIHALTKVDHTRLVEIDANWKMALDAQTRKLESMDVRISSISDSQAAIVDGQSMLLDGQIGLLNRQTRLDPTDPEIMRLSNEQSSLTDGQARLEVMITQMHKIVASNQSTLSLTRRAVYRLEFHHILEFFVPKTLPSSALRKVKPLSQRMPTMADRRLESMLRNWGSSPQSSILVLHAGIREQKQSTELAADVVNHLRSNSQFVFWNISTGLSGQNVTMEDVFKSIIYQALQQCGATFADLSEQLHPQKIHGSHTDSEWTELICLLFAKLPAVFLVLETKDLRNTYSDDRDWTAQLLGYLQTIVDHTATAKCVIKVLLLLYGSKTDLAPSAPLKKSVRTASLQPHAKIPARLKHKAGHPSLNMKGWRLDRSTLPSEVRR